MTCSHKASEGFRALVVEKEFDSTNLIRIERTYLQVCVVYLGFWIQSQCVSRNALMARAVAQGPGLKIKECPPLRAFLYIFKQVHLFNFTLVSWESMHYLGKSALHLSEMPHHG
jgi:hypothetical protein